MFPVKLTTGRLLLRQPVAGDAGRIVELLNNWNVVKWIARADYPYGRAHAEDFLARNAKRTFARDDVVYAIESDRSLVGVISVSPQRRGPNLGYWLGEPYWGKGIMTEAAGAVIEGFFRPTGKDVPGQTLVSGVFRGNDASLAIQRKFGFVVVGESSVMCVSRGEGMVHVDTELTRRCYEEYKELRS